MKAYLKCFVILTIIIAALMYIALLTGCTDKEMFEYDAEKALYELEKPDWTRETQELYKIRKQFELLNKQLIEKDSFCIDYNTTDSEEA